MEKNQSNFLISSFALRACIQKKIKEEEKKLYIFEAMNLIKLKYPKIITDVQYKEALGKGNLYITKLENDSNGYYHFSTSDIHVSSDNIDSSDKDFIHKVIHKLYLRHTAENVGFSNIEFILFVAFITVVSFGIITYLLLLGAVYVCSILPLPSTD